MKSFFGFLLALLVATGVASHAQIAPATTTTATTATVTPTAATQTTTTSTSRAPRKSAKTTKTTRTTTGPLKKDGTPDRRYKVNRTTTKTTKVGL